MSKKKMFIVTNEKDDEQYRIIAHSSDDVRHWTINHLDLSKEWNISNFLSRWWYKNKGESDGTIQRNSRR